MKFGVNVWSFPKGFDPLEAIRKAKEIGYHGFEPALTIDHMGIAISDFDKFWRSLANVSRDVSIEIPSVATGLFWRINPMENLEEALKVVERLCRAAHLVEAKVVLVTVGSALSEKDFNECFERAAHFLKKASAIAREYNVLIGVENVWNKILGSPLEMKELLGKVNEDNVKAYLDVGNTLPHSLPEHWIDVLGSELIAQIHVKDFNLAELKFGIPLTGDVNWRAISKRLKAISYKGYLVAEVPPYRGHPLRAVEDTFKSLKEIFGE